MAKSSTPNSSKYSYNVLSNRENLEDAKKKIVDSIKIDLFETMKIDELMVNRNILSNSIGKNRYENGIEGKNEGIPGGKIVLKDGVEIDLGNKYSDLINEYKRLINDKPEGYENELKKLDTKLAERITLDEGFAIEFKSEDEFDDGKNAEEEAQLAYNGLNELKDYKGRIDLVSKKKDNIDYFVIKWKPNQIAKINMALKMIDKVSSMNSQEIDNLQKENDEKDRKIQDLMKKLDEAQNNKDNVDENHNKKEDNKGQENNNESNESNEKEKEEFLRRLKEYCPRLFEGHDKPERSEHREESRESVEKNPLYVSRKDVENSVLASRKDSDFPIGNVEIKGTYVKLEEFDFYEEIKQEYIFAKGDSIKLAELDKKLAELVILCSPRGVSVEQRYQIQLTEEEIIAGGLVVSQEFLARYGLAIDYFEYTNTIIEREYQEKLEIIQKIETQITELTSTITELTRKITIEESSSESIVLEITRKREKVKVLKEKMYALLLSLRSSGNKGIDKDLLALKEREKQLQKELDGLKEQKKHQDDVNKRIKELQEKIAKLKGNDREKQLQSKQKELEEMLGYIEELKKQKREKESRYDSDKVTDIEKITLKEEIAKLDKDIKRYEESASKLQNEIDKLKNGLNGNDTEKQLQSKQQELEEMLGYIEGLKKQKREKDSRFDSDKVTDIEKITLKEEIAKLDKDIKRYEESASKLEKEIKKIKEQLDKLDNQPVPSDDVSKLESELADLLKEQEGFDKDIDKKIADKEKELADVREKIKNKETKRVVVESFDDGDGGSYFYRFCEQNGIKRKDGKEIFPIGGMDPDAIYVDKDGRELKLEWIKGANDDGYDNPVTHYELVYYEGGESAGTDDIEKQLLIIIHEQEELEAELEQLEIKLRKEKSESIRITIEEEIKKIQQKLVILKQSIVDITNSTKIYKETITQHRYAVIRLRQIPVILPPIQQQNPFEMTAVLSDMGTDVFREKASLKVEENLKAYYKSLGRWQVGSRLALFLGRGHRRKRMIRREMNNMANTAFQTGAGYSALNEQSQNAADRHKHELDTGMAAVNQLATVHNPQVDQLCKDYLNNVVNDAQFQQQFNTIIANDANIQNILNGQNITHIGTNILLRLQEQKALNQLILNMDAQLAQYVMTGNTVYMDNMRNYVSQYIKDYQKTPAFMADFEQFVKGDLNARNRLRQYLNHQRAIMNMQITNLRMNIDILNKGKSAYQIDNKDRETGKGSWKYRLGHRMDKHPRGTVLGSTAISIGIGLGTGLIASPVLAGAVSLGLFGGLVGTTNAVKKWTHHTKEQNTHEKNMVTDYRNEQAKIQAWQNQALNGHGRRRYKAKRQLALYDQTTQENIQMSDQITEYITNLSSKVGPLTADEDNFMRCNLIEGWARLKYYRQMGHNFLASEEVDKTEKDMKRLEKSITLGLQKIGKTTNDIETNMTATNQQNTNITYAVIQNDLKASYDKSLIQFKRERRNLSLKYGFGTAIASIGVGAFFQWITGSGIFAGKDIPATPGTPGTPGTPESTTSYSSGTDNFALGKYDLPGTTSYADSGNIYSNTKSVISSSSVPDGSHAIITYGVGTDGTTVKAGHLGSKALKAQLKAVEDNINAMPWGTHTPQRDAFLTELGKLKSTGFTNDNLATMRAAEELEHYAQGIADGMATTGKDIMVDGFNRGLDKSGTLRDNVAERFMTGSIDITTPAIPGTPGIPGDPGRKAVRRGRWFMGLPLFFNTWKDRKAKKDTTDQNFGRGSQQQPKQPQPQPKQPNPNQPQNP